MIKTITLTCYNRPEYLSMVIKSLSDVFKDLNGYRLFCAVEPWCIENIKILESIDFVEKEIILNERNKGVTDNPYSILNYVFEKQHSDFNIYLEEDIIFSPDTIRYLDFCLDAFKEEEDIVCYHCYNHDSIIEEPNKIKIINYYRFNTGLKLPTFSAWVFAVTKDKWMKYFKPNWYKNSSGWDWGIIDCIFEKKLKIVMPTLSRSKHIGEFGVHMTQDMQTIISKIPYNEKDELFKYEISGA